MPYPLVSMKLRLMHLELLMLQWELGICKDPIWLLVFGNTYTECIAELNKIRDIEKLFTDKEKVFKFIVKSYQSPVLSIDQLSYFDRELENLLKELYIARISLWKKIDLILTVIEKLELSNLIVWHQAKQAFMDINEELDGMICKLNRNERDVTRPEELNEFSERLKNSQEYFTKLSKILMEVSGYRQLLEEFLKKLLGKNFSLIQRICQDVLFLQFWDKELKEKKKKCPRLSELKFALYAKQILFNHKGQCLVVFYSPSSPIVICAIRHLITENLSEPVNTLGTIILEILRHKDQELRGKINQEENELRNYGWLAEIESSVVRLWTENHYFKMASGYFELIEELTKEGLFQGTPLAQPLTPGYLHFFKNVGTVSLLGIDFFLQRYLSKSARFGSINVLHQVLLPQTETIIYALERLGLHEETAVKIVPKIEWIIGLFLYSTIGLFNTDFHRLFKRHNYLTKF